MPAFTSLFDEVCSQFNITVPILGSNSSVNGTNVTFPAHTAPSVVPYTGVAGQSVDAAGTVAFGISLLAMMASILGMLPM